MERYELEFPAGVAVPIYRLVQNFPGAGIMAQDFDPARGADPIAAMDVRGFPYLRVQEQHKGGIKLRDELVGQPIFAGIIGPMWGGYVDEAGAYLFGDDAAAKGRPVIRYEDQAAYDRLSA